MITGGNADAEKTKPGASAERTVTKEGTGGSGRVLDVDQATGQIKRALESGGGDVDFGARAVREVEEALAGEGGPAPELPQIPGAG